MQSENQKLFHLLCNMLIYLSIDWEDVWKICHWMSVAVFFFTRTYITQDHESFSQSFTKQSDPFGKQLVQMFTEMLTHNHKSGRRSFSTLAAWIQPAARHIFISFNRDSRLYWFCRPGPAYHSNKAPHSGSPDYTVEYNNHLNRRDLNNQSLFVMDDCAPVMPNTRTL